MISKGVQILLPGIMNLKYDAIFFGWIAHQSKFLFALWYFSEILDISLTLRKKGYREAEIS